MTTKITQHSHSIKPEVKLSGVIVKNEKEEVIKTIKGDKDDH